MRLIYMLFLILASSCSFFSTHEDDIVSGLDFDFVIIEKQSSDMTKLHLTKLDDTLFLSKDLFLVQILEFSNKENFVSNFIKSDSNKIEFVSISISSKDSLLTDGVDFISLNDCYKDFSFIYDKNQYSIQFRDINDFILLYNNYTLTNGDFYKILFDKVLLRISLDNLFEESGFYDFKLKMAFSNGNEIEKVKRFFVKANL